MYILYRGLYIYIFIIHVIIYECLDMLMQQLEHCSHFRMGRLGMKGLSPCISG